MQARPTSAKWRLTADSRPEPSWRPRVVEGTSRMKSCVLPALALVLALPTDGYGQAVTEPNWLECFAPNECDVRVVASALHSRKGRLRLLAERAASACQAAGYTHYVEGAAKTAGFTGIRLVQRVYFTNDGTPPARPCSFSATAESEAEAKQMARARGYPWPGDEERFTTHPAWTFEPGENDRGRAGAASGRNQRTWRLLEEKRPEHCRDAVLGTELYSDLGGRLTRYRRHRRLVGLHRRPEHRR